MPFEISPIKREFGSYELIFIIGTPSVICILQCKNELK